MLRFRILVGLVAVLVTSSCAGPVEFPAGANGRVRRVVDGDTLIVEIAVDDRVVSETVRLIGIDTPETKKPDSPVECFGPEATRRTESLLPPDTWVILDLDRETRDAFDRLLAYVHRWNDGTFVNLTLVAEGYASVLPIAPNTSRADEFQRAEATARTGRLGMWGTCFDTDR